MTGILLIAAGTSRRLGQPKQLVLWKGVTLIRHAALVALEADLGPVTVVLGAIDELCRHELDGLPLEIVTHPDWAEGMGGSIATGLAAMKDLPDLEGVIVMLCDQPLIDAQALLSLVQERRRTHAAVVVSKAGSIKGPPVWFAASHFPALLALKGTDGAKTIIQNEPSVATVECPAAAFDVDTPEDLEKLSRF